MIFLSCKEKPNNLDKYPTEPATTNLNGQQLAEIHCAACHSYVPPQMLSKSIWKQDVLPAMGNRLGIYNGAHQPDSIFGSPRNATFVKEAKVFPEHPVIAKADWQKIVDYYITNGRNEMQLPKKEQAIKTGLKHFKYKEVSYVHRPPLTTMVKILENNNGLVFSDGKRNNNVLTFLSSNLELDKNVVFKNTPINYYEKSDSIYVTTIGKNIFPTDTSDGAIQIITRTEDQQIKMSNKPILTGLQRPVSMAYGDLNNDNKQDIVACEYGDLTGKLVWYENDGKNEYKPHILATKSGAISAIITDYNKDGNNDIFVLMAQGDEGIFFYENQGNGTFKEKRLLSFLPLNGSQYMELADFNNDGFDDIIYVCGDNADKTPILKEYHGVYIFLNDGELNFNQAYFYQQNGAYKAMPRDYDLDGDLDIASISFFPDYAQYPEESFVYLENKGDLRFEASSFPQATKGRWIVMDAGDIDADGDIDIALGSFVYFLAKGDSTGLSKKWLTKSPSVIILENTTK